MEPVKSNKSNEQIVMQSKIQTGQNKSENDKVHGNSCENNLKRIELKLTEKLLKDSSVLHNNPEEIERGNALDTFKAMETNEPADAVDIREAVTPELSMDIEQTELSHVRKINFDELGGNESSPDESKTKSPSNGNISSDDKLSRSAGCLNLKTMLEGKDENKLNLNKSMGFLECSKNALFANQSTIPGRSAFVPFSQVQSLCKKDNPNASQSVAMAIPVIMPSGSQTQSSETVTQSAGITMIALPTDMQTSPIKNPSELIQSLFKPQTSQQSEITLQTPLTDSVLPFSIQNQTKESIGVVSVSSVLSKMTGSECIVTSAQSSQKQMRMKFTPIRPKASPSKGPIPKETKTEVLAYDKDKRPVSAILKEKRAKEQAEALTKSIRLSSIPFQPNISLAGPQISALQAVPTGSANISNEVVIIVNNQPVKVQQIVGQSSAMPASTIAYKPVNSQTNTASSQSLADKETSQLNQDLANTYKSEKKTGSDSSDTCLLDDENDIADVGSISSDIKELSPMNEERGITPILQEGEDTLLLSDAESDININVNTNNIEKGGNLPSRMSNILSPGSVDQMWLETPRKIQKLNITSPFQEECSLGRETPIRISKHSDSCSSRPESACSYGRETPSGARKRKSSDFQPRRDIKRLNSTGEDSEDIHNLSLVLSPESDFNIGLNPRRTQSCTDELDKDSKLKRQHQATSAIQQQRQSFHQLQLQKPSADALLQGLQSPDIHSLEREALIESFPNSLFAMKPNHKLHRNQSNSIGVNAKSLRQSQQKLIRQQQYLDERVKNFLQTKSETSEDVRQLVCKDGSEHRTSLLSPSNSRIVQKADNLVVTDRGKPYQRPSSVATMSRNSTSDMETSDLPSDVADWINDIMEQRQSQNQSAMSEPDCRKETTVKADRPLNIQNFSFGSDHEMVRTSTANNNNKIIAAKNHTDEIQKTQTPALSDDNNFTVPKAPPVTNLRIKDLGRQNTDAMSSSQRCQSLPIFASPVQSPVSPSTLSSQIARNHGNRAASMSPRGQSVDTNVGILSPTNSSVRRKEIRETMVTGSHPGLVHRDSKQGTYLASIQHTLQKPVDIPNDAVSPLDSALNHTQSSSAVLGGKPQSLLHQRSRESSLDMDDRHVSQTPFSDSGYHSSGPSPILNSTPVSAVDGSDLSHGAGCSLSSQKHSVAESPITMVAGNTSPLSQQSLNRPQLINQQQSVTIATSQMNNFGGNPSQLRSSIHSAFIPIQGSNNIRYVSPIKPLVTLPNNSQDLTPVIDNTSGMSNLYINPNNGMLSSDIMVSPHSSDPPSYEIAIKQLKKSTPPKSVHGPNDLSNVTLENQNGTEQNLQFVAQASAIFPSIHGNEKGLNRPYSQKLIELSRQSIVADKNDLLSNEMLSSDKDAVSLTTMFMMGDDQQQAPPTYRMNQSNSRSSVTELEQNGANSTFNFSSDQLIQNNAIGDTNNVFNESVLNENIDSMVGRPSHSDVLNIDTSYQSNSQFESTNQNEAVLPTMHQLTTKSSTSENQLLNKPSFCNKGELNEFSQFQSQNDEINIFTSSGGFSNNECSNNYKNTLISGGKLSAPGYELVCDNVENKTAENFNQNSQDSMEDIGIPWESLGEIGKDFGDFSMF